MKELQNELLRQMSAIKGARIDDYDADVADFILETTAKVLQIPLAIIKSPIRQREPSDARFIIVYLVKKYTMLKLKPIAKLIGNRDHSTVIYCNDQAKDLIVSNPAFKQKLNLVEAELTDENTN